VNDITKAILLGLVEGATEFIPVSSTGHLILAGEWLAFREDVAATFEIFIQLGAILAIVWLYWRKLFEAVRRWRTDPVARRLIVNLAIAFVPAAAVGFLIHGWIKEYPFSPVTVAAALVVGGFGILAVERYRPKSTTESVDDVSNRSALGVGLAQILSLFPGVSRSGATIMGGMAIGLSRTAATEFSFFVAVPIMVAATGYELMSSRELLTPDLVPVLAVGFVTSFVSAAIVVKALLRFVSRHSFAPFAWYRIVFGGLLLVYYLGTSGA
jgi:undecaprenyl-diphosphatase